MKAKEYLKELSLAILGVFIALLIDNYRENLRDAKTIGSYLDIIKEDLNFDIVSLTEQLKADSVYARRLGYLSDVLTTNSDLPQLKFSLSAWTRQNVVPYRKLSSWDSLDYYAIQLYSNNQYEIRKIGFSTILNSNLSQQIDLDLLKKITVYYTTESNKLDFVSDVDDRCHWLGIEFCNKYQGSFKDLILTSSFNATQLRNEVSGRYKTTLSEMSVKRDMIQKAKELIASIER